MQDDTLFVGFSLLAQRFSREAACGRVLPFSNLLDLLARLHLGQVKSAPCGAGLGYLAMDAEGRFFLCHRLAGVARFRSATSIPASITPRSARALPRSRRRARTHAGACWARSLCAGGCHHENHVRETELGLPPGGSCEFIRRWIELGIRVYADLCSDPGNPVLAFLARRADG